LRAQRLRWQASGDAVLTVGFFNGYSDALECAAVDSSDTHAHMMGATPAEKPRDLWRQRQVDLANKCRTAP
jgi:hypothetical protein